MQKERQCKEGSALSVACSDGKEDGAQTKFLNQPAANLHRSGWSRPTTASAFMPGGCGAKDEGQSSQSVLHLSF